MSLCLQTKMLWADLRPPRIHMLKSQPPRLPVPQNVTILESKVFTTVIKLNDVFSMGHNSI